MLAVCNPEPLDVVLQGVFIHPGSLIKYPSQDPSLLKGNQRRGTTAHLFYNRALRDSIL